MKMRKLRCEHNCHLCKKEFLGRCHGDQYGKDVSIDDTPVCSGYVYNGTEKHLKEIMCAESLGVKNLYYDEEEIQNV